MQNHTLSGSLWKHSNKLGVANWKHKWVYVDRQKLVQFHEEAPPENNETAPNHTFFLYRTKITFDTEELRPFSFRVTDTIDGRTIVYALENDYECQKWTDFIAQKIKKCRNPTVMEGANLNTVPTSLEGPLLKYKKNALGVVRWKRKWVKVDEYSFRHWYQDTKPAKEEEGVKHDFQMFRTTITEASELRPCAFRLTDELDGRSMIFAAENVVDYERWLNVLTKGAGQTDDRYDLGNTESFAAFKEESEANAAQGSGKDITEGTKITMQDFIIDYFRKNNLSGEDEIDLTINFTQLRALINFLDPSLNLNIAQHVYEDSKLHIGTPITQVTFLKWWTEFQHDSTDANFSTFDVALTSSATSQKPRPLSIKEEISFVGAVDIPTLQRMNLTRAALLQFRMPVVPQGGDMDRYRTYTGGDWNESFQRLCESASRQYFTRVGQSYGTVTKAPKVGETDSFTPKPDDMPHLDACAQLAHFHGEFVEAAIEGAKLIIDEYSLPEQLKTAKRVAVKDLEDHKDADEGFNDAKEEVYVYHGLVYRVAATAALESDELPARDRQQQLALSDMIMHKQAGCDLRGVEAVQASVSQMQTTEFLHVQRDMCKGLFKKEESATRFRKAQKMRNKMKASEGEGNVKICTPLTAIVDYAGFRVSVSCPIPDISKFKTLMHGYCPEAKLFVDCTENLQSSLDALYKKLNIRTTARDISSTKDSLSDHFGISDNDDSPFYKMQLANKYADLPEYTVEMMAQDLEVHSCRDGRVYMLNLHSLMPTDMPRKENIDHSLRQLRPEFVRSCKNSISPLAMMDIDFTGVMVPAIDNDFDFYEQMDFYDKITKDGLVPRSFLDPGAIRYHFEAMEFLWCDHLPRVASELDSQSHIPMDSYSLTNFMHSRGLNMRMLGTLYEMCQVNSVRRLLLTEAVARTCKTIYNQTLRSMARKGAAEGIAAQYRGRSAEEDYMDHKDYSLLERATATMKFFNIVLGHGKASTQFWKGRMLMELLESRFNLKFSQSNKIVSVHLPQLFLAMQYHLGVSFKDKTGYKFGDPSIQNPLDDDDVVNLELASVKSHISMPGLIGAADALAEAYLAAGMYTDAINAFRLRLMLLNLSAPEVAKTSPKYISAVSYCTYNLCSAIFLSGDLSTAMVEIKDYFASFPTFTAIGGRMMSLLMCCNFQLGRVDTAVQLYDMAATVYAFAVGANHSIHAVHMCTLGDLYREQSLVAKGGRSLSRVMMTMATETSKSFLGEGHRLSVAYSVKLAILCLEEGAYTDAGNLLNTAIGFYESYPVQNRFVAREIVRGAYLLAAAYARMNDTFEAIHWAEISTVKAEMAYTNDTPLYVIDTLVLLSDLYVKMKNLPKSVAAVRKAIEVVRCGVENHADIGHLLARLVCKLLRVNAMAQRLQPRELMHILAGEEKSMYPAAFQLGIPGPEFRINYPAEFEKGCSLVFSALWDLPGDEFFNTLMSQINAQEVSEEVFEQKVSSESKANNFVGTSTDLLAVSRGVQGSVLMDLIENTKMDW